MGSIFRTLSGELPTVQLNGPPANLVQMRKDIATNWSAILVLSGGSHIERNSLRETLLREMQSVSRI